MMDEIAKLATQRLIEEKDSLKKQFEESLPQVGTRYFYVDSFLPEDLASKIYEAFPEPTAMRFMNSFRERKYTSKNFDQFSPLLKETTFALQQKSVIKAVENITGLKDQKGDPTLYAGGLSSMASGNFLNPHIDNSHDEKRENYRTLNLLFYVSPNWNDENGGHLELWDPEVKKNVTLHSRFNRLAVMETHPTSWHSVSEVKVNRPRNCVSNYYFSPHSPLGKEYFHVTEFSARPEQPLKRTISKIDNVLRSGIRKFIKDGLSKKDGYHL